MKIPTLFAAPLAALLLAGLLLTGCAEPMDPPDTQAPKPEPVRFTGRIVDREGPCHSLRSFSTGRIYAVRPDALGELPANSVVRVKGVFLGRRGDCPHPMIRLTDLQAQ